MRREMLTAPLELTPNLSPSPHTTEPRTRNSKRERFIAACEERARRREGEEGQPQKRVEEAQGQREVGEREEGGERREEGGKEGEAEGREEGGKG